jgi:hypothetical protein
MDRTRTNARLPLVALALLAVLGIALLALAVLGIALAAPASGEAKKGPAKCKQGRVPVKVNGKTSCQPLASALPKPKAIDPRLAYLRAALNFDASKLRGRHGKHPRSLKHGFGAAGKKARKAFLRALPQALAKIDALAWRAPRSARRLPGLAVASKAGCGQGAPVSSPGHIGGLSIQVTAGNGGEGAFMEFTTKGITFRLSFTKCGGGYGVPQCPTANGDVDGSGSGSFEVSVRVLEGGGLVSAQSTSIRTEDKLHGQVAADALLDYLDYEHTDETLIVASGGIVLRSTETRRARVNMRSGQYDPQNSSVTIKGDKIGISEKSFPADVAAAIGAYRKAETAWNVPNACVKLQFSPASRTLKLRRGQHGSFSVQAVAVRDGGAAQGRWTRTGQQNASLTPDLVDGANPQFSYEVTNAGKNIIVTATVRVTSKAGVGEGSWEQETEDVPLYRGMVSGTAGKNVPGDCGLVMQWSYNASLAADTAGSDPFPILLPDPYGGVENAGRANAYDETGSGTFTFAPCHGEPGCSTTVERDPDGGNGLVIFEVVGDTVEATVDAMAFKGHDDDCSGDVFNRIGSGTFPRSMIGADTITVDLSYNDDPSFAFGNGTLTLNRVN